MKINLFLFIIYKRFVIRFAWWIHFWAGDSGFVGNSIPGLEFCLFFLIVAGCVCGSILSSWNFILLTGVLFGALAKDKFVSEDPSIGPKINVIINDILILQPGGLNDDISARRL